MDSGSDELTVIHGDARVPCQFHDCKCSGAVFSKTIARASNGSSVATKLRCSWVRTSTAGSHGLRGCIYRRRASLIGPAYSSDFCFVSTCFVSTCFVST
jgi:hypothetical protein